MNSIIVSLDTEDIYDLLVSKYGWSEERAEKAIKTVTQDELDDLAWAIADIMDLDAFWEGLEKNLESCTNIELKDEPA